MLPSQRMLLPLVMLIDALMLPRLRTVTAHMLFMRLELLLIHFRQLMHRHLQICHQRITPTAGKVLAYNHAHHLQRLAVRCHGVCGHDPAAFTELMGDGELIELVAVFGVETECDQRKTFAAGFGHEDEAHFLYTEG